MKHGLGLPTAVHRLGSASGKQAVLLYLHAEPSAWGRLELYRAEITRFAELINGDKVAFRSCMYRQLLTSRSESADPVIRAHAEAVTVRFAV